ncbi:MAG: hypothetical protein ACE1Y4_09690 [Lysobacterales bacterium]
MIFRRHRQNFRCNMRVKVKICGLKRGRDVRAAVSCGADAVDFVFAAGSKREIDPYKARELVHLVPAFVARAGQE